MSRQITCDICGKTADGLDKTSWSEFSEYLCVDVNYTVNKLRMDICNDCSKKFEIYGRKEKLDEIVSTEPAKSNEDNAYKVGDIVNFSLITGEKVQALAVKEEDDCMLFILYDCLNKEYTMNEILDNGVLDKIYEAFPTFIKSIMKPFESGYLRLPTEKEIFGCNEYGEDEGDEVEQFEPMKLRRNRVASQGLNGNYVWWWLANKTVASGSLFALVYGNGGSYSNGASAAGGVRPLFKLDNKVRSPLNKR